MNLCAFKGIHTAMANRIYLINADWDQEAQVWVATSSDVPGLVTEAETLEALQRKLDAIVPELLELNDVGQGAGDAFEVITRRITPLQPMHA